GDIAQKIPTVFLADLQGVDLDLFALGKFFDLLGQGLHIGGHRPGKRRGFEKGNIIVDLFDPTVDKTFHAALDDDKAKDKAQGWEKQGERPYLHIPKPKKTHEKNSDTQADQ